MLSEENLNNVEQESIDFDENIIVEETSFIAPTTSILLTPNISTPSSSNLKRKLSPIFKTHKKKLSQNENNMGSSNCFFFFKFYTAVITILTF